MQAQTCVHAHSQCAARALDYAEDRLLDADLSHRLLGALNSAHGGSAHHRLP